MIAQSMLDLVGHTPLVKIRGAWDNGDRATIWAKMENLNPGGSVKDRICRAMIEDAEARGLLKPPGPIVEPTSGNTGIGLAHVCNARGYGCIIYMPDTQSQEKVDLLRTLGAEVRLIPAVPYANPMNYQKQAGRFAETLENGVWANQFDNLANRQAHYESTGPEIWAQSGGRVDAFSHTGTCSGRRKTSSMW